MQHGPLTPPTYPGSCKTCFSRKPVFGGNFLLIFPIIYQIAHLHNWPIWPLILPTAVLDGRFTLGASFPFSWVSWLLNFIETRCASFNTSDITNYIEITWSVMPKPVSLLTVQEAHKEYSSLTDQIRAKYKQLDSGEFRSPGTPAFILLKPVNWLIYLLMWSNFVKDWTSQCQINSTGPCSSSIEDTFRIKTTGRQSWLGYGGCSFVPIDM